MDFLQRQKYRGLPCSPFEDGVRQVVTLHIKPSTRGMWQHQLERDIKHQLNAGSVGLVHKVVKVHLMRN